MKYTLWPKISSDNFWWKLSVLNFNKDFSTFIQYMGKLNNNLYKLGFVISKYGWKLNKKCVQRFRNWHQHRWWTDKLYTRYFIILCRMPNKILKPCVYILLYLFSDFLLLWNTDMETAWLGCQLKANILLLHVTWKCDAHLTKSET